MPPKRARARGGGGAGGKRRKSLLIGINYTGSQHELNGCHADVENVQRFLSNHGYPDDPKSQLVLRDDKKGKFYPTGAHMLAAMDWLVSEPNCTCFFHYSGHGGQVRDPDGDRPTGYDDTLVPVDYEEKGQIVSDILHEHLVTNLAQGCTLFVVLDCCHSGSALELPFTYRSDSDGNVSLMDNLKQGYKLVGQASHLIQGGLSLSKMGEAKELYAGATDFFRGFQHSRGNRDAGDDDDGEGELAEEHFAEDRTGEHKVVSMFSGCKDEQTSADANIKGKATGAMSWAFLNTLRENPKQSYLSALQGTRKLLDESSYEQIPQLSMGTKMDLDTPLLM